MKNRLGKLYIAILLYLSSIFIGIMGYQFIQGLSFVDAFYMTMITISTVGFGEVEKFNTAGKIFASVYILYNLCILAYVISVISKYLFEGELKEIFNTYMSSREIRKLEGHVIVCGFGRNGQRACEELQKEGVPFVVIDLYEDILKKKAEEKSFFYIVGDATEESNLKAANIEKASALITAVPKDNINVFVTLTARELNKGIYIIARANLDSTISKLRTAGADKVVLPDQIGGRYMADLVTKPQIIDFLDTISGAEGDLQLVKINVSTFRPEFKEKTIVQLQTRANSGVNILGYKGDGQEYIFNPPADMILEKNSVLMILGNNDDIYRFKTKYTIQYD